MTTLDLPIAGQWAYGSKYSSREGAKIDTLLIHGGAVTSTAGLKSTLEGGRNVSANFGIGSRGGIYRHVPEHLRAFTSGASGDGGRGAAFDRRAITVEVAQVSSTPWAFSREAEDEVVRIGIAMRRDGMLPVIKRSPGQRPIGVIGHRELALWYDASYPTECPAGWPDSGLDRISGRILTEDTIPTDPEARKDTLMQVITTRPTVESAKRDVYLQTELGRTHIMHPSHVATIRSYLAGQTDMLEQQAAIIEFYVTRAGLAKLDPRWQKLDEEIKKIGTVITDNLLIKE